MLTCISSLEEAYQKLKYLGKKIWGNDSINTRPNIYPTPRSFANTEKTIYHLKVGTPSSQIADSSLGNRTRIFTTRFIKEAENSSVSDINSRTVPIWNSTDCMEITNVTATLKSDIDRQLHISIYLNNHATFRIHILNVSSGSILALNK